VVGKTVSVDEVMSVVVRDAKYYVKSGGGLTLSGGEPLLQPAFARELLAEAKKHGIHTCLDTTGYCRTADLLSLWDLVDLFLYDYKETDPKRHREYTGVDNGLILEHLARINSHGKSIVLRCPIIPGRNDRQDHFERIAEISRELTNIVEINVLPFHPFAQSKSAQVGREYRCADTPAVSRAVADAWVRDLQARVRVPVRHG
jgi:pyruvate formate lyase activating enzyme